MSAEGGRLHKSRVYVEVTIPNELGEPISFAAEGEVTAELDVRALHKILQMSEEEIINKLGLRDKLM